MGKRAITRRGGRRGRNRGRRGDRRRQLGPLALGGLGLAGVIVLGGAVFAFLPGGDEGASTAGEVADVLVDPSRTAPTASAPPKRPSASSSSPAPGAGSGEASPNTSVTPSAPRSSGPPPPPRVPASGPGTFTTARTEGGRVGSGPLRRYRVQVEKGIDISAAEAAAEIEHILAHPRGWAAHGRGSFQLVSSNADFVIRIATPATADRLCLAQGLNTHGELNCETVDGVVVNLRRWVLGSPTFDGPAAHYRHLIINHEVGHEIGLRQHLGCSGPGRLAPVMMQQIKGLDGCVSNAWPYDKNGKYITGPTV
ncbi:DUF3152 domain-containing protein [Streptomyces sp. NPDC050804]|uniref:DUF3152 domain-containing protein n=1 Tax=Streptomyces sp. NPDC050804 TaxID=3154745 RepID=UPI00341CD4BD